MTGAEKLCRTCEKRYSATLVFCPDDGTVLESSDGDALVGTIIADRFRIISRIGEGGMGQVYLAEHVHMHRKCAVKFLHPDLADNASALKRFMREAENASRIDHPNVVIMYDFGQAEGGSVYLAMEFVEGESLRARIERQGALPNDLIGSIIRQTASALAAAHQLEIVHRDLKPDNIMLITRGDEVRVKVVDFGIAKARGAAQKVTVTGAIVGTPDYMSPEQVAGDEMDGRSDQYSLALVAVKMLTGKLPFADTKGIESLTSRLFTEPTPLRSLRADVAWPQQLQDVITRALDGKPENRYGSVMEFARAFDKALSAVHGALAATVPELKVGADVIPATRQRAPRDVAAGKPSASTPRSARRPVLTAAAVGVLVAGAGALWQLRPADEAPTSRLNLPIAIPEGALSDSAVRPQTGAATHVDSQLAPQSVAAATPATTLAGAPVGATASAGQPATPSAAQRPEPAPTQAAVRQPDPTTRPAPAPAARDTSPSQPPAAAAPPARTQEPAAEPPAQPARPSALTADEVGAELARVRPMMQPEAARSDVEGAITALDRMLPRIGRADSIRVLYARAQASALLDDLPSACRALGRAATLAAGTRVHDAIVRTSRDLSCQ